MSTSTFRPSSPVRARRKLPAVPGGHVGARLATVLVLAAALVTLLLAVPGLRPVARELGRVDPALVAAAIALELASCASFVVIFRLFFPRVAGRPARRLAWAQMGSGALLPGGGVGALAVGAWLLHRAGMPTREIVRRSSGLFFLTSGTNVLSLAVAGAVLLAGVGTGPHDGLRSGVPLIAGVAAVVLALAAARWTARLADRRRLTWVAEVGRGVPEALAALRRPHLRLLGGLGYLWCDIAVLWLALAAVGPAPAIAPIVVAYLVGYLAAATPIPGGVGVLDAGLTGALVLYGLPVERAAAAVLVYHAIAFWIPALGGLFGYAGLRSSTADAGPAE